MAIIQSFKRFAGDHFLNGSVLALPVIAPVIVALENLKNLSPLLFSDEKKEWVCNSYEDVSTKRVFLRNERALVIRASQLVNTFNRVMGTSVKLIISEDSESVDNSCISGRGVAAFNYNACIRFYIRKNSKDLDTLEENLDLLIAKEFIRIMQGQYSVGYLQVLAISIATNYVWWNACQEEMSWESMSYGALKAIGLGVISSIAATVFSDKKHDEKLNLAARSLIATSKK